MSQIKKKIALLTSSFLPLQGGLQYETAWLLEAIDQLLESEEYRHLTYYFFAPNDAALNYCNYKNIEVINLRIEVETALHAGKVLKSIFKVKKALNIVQPDIIHCQGIIPDAMLVACCNFISFQKYKYMITSHGSDLVIIPEIQYGARLNPLINIVSKLVLGKVEKHFLPSTALKKYAYEAGSDKDRVIVVPNGVKQKENYNNQQLISQIKKNFDIKDTDFCLLSLSGMRPIKRLDVLLEGFKGAKEKVPNLKLFLACKGSLLGQFKQMAKENGLDYSVKFIGFIEGETKDAFFKICHLFCLTSLFENFPISLLEAMDYKMSILATNVGGIPDFVKHNVNGILVEQGNAKQVCQAIIDISTDKELQTKLMKNAAITAKDFNITVTAKKYLNLY